MIIIKYIMCFLNKKKQGPSESIVISAKADHNFGFVDIKVLPRSKDAIIKTEWGP